MKKGMKGGKYEHSNPIKSGAGAGRAEAAAESFTMPKPLGGGGPSTTAGKRLPPAPAKSAIAEKVQGSPGAPAKNPAVNPGGSRKLGNHW